uniref:C2H2-type domain-containing protein n=1 Tax=Lates calcarifer TaxID=8187 RepID=A0A4W6ECR1_LATCA
LAVYEPILEITVVVIVSNCHQSHQAPKGLLYDLTFPFSSGERPYKCTHCGKAFNQKVVLQTHMVRHTGEKPHLCMFCPASFSQKGNLHSHVQRVHSEVRQHSTDTNNGQLLHFSFPGSIREENGVRWHGCPYCSKEFKKPSDLVRHIRIHTHEKPFKCKQCFRAFAVKSTLTAHMKTHTGERPYKCVQCSRGFASSGVLKAHIRTHSGLKAYKCLMCDTTFTTSGSLRRHMTTHSDLRIPWITV